MPRGPSAAPHARGLRWRRRGNPLRDNPRPRQHSHPGKATAPTRRQRRRAGVAVPHSHPPSTLGCRHWEPAPTEPSAAGSRPALPRLHLGLHLIDNIPSAVTCRPLCMTRAGIHWGEIAWNKISRLVTRLCRPPLPLHPGSTQTLPASPCPSAGWPLHARRPLPSEVFPSRLFPAEGKIPSKCPRCCSARRGHPQPQPPAPTGQSQPGEQTPPAPVPPHVPSPASGCHETPSLVPVPATVARASVSPSR